MNFNNPPAICIGECYVCLEEMRFEDYAKDEKQRMTMTCGDVKHQICKGCFDRLQKPECPMCKQKILKWDRHPPKTTIILQVGSFAHMTLFQTAYLISRLEQEGIDVDLIL